MESRISFDVFWTCGSSFLKKNDQKEGLAYGDYVKEHPRERNSIQSGGGSDKYILHLGRG